MMGGLFWTRGLCKRLGCDILLIKVQKNYTLKNMAMRRIRYAK
jgi:hypothetical protein